MKIFSWSLLSLIMIAMISISCDRIKPNAPKETSLDSLLPLPLSTLVIPVHYEVTELEKTINNKVQGTFIHEWIKLNDKGDSLYLEITKRDFISLSWKGKTLSYSFPIKVSGKFIKSVGKRFKVKNHEPIEMEMVLHLSTKLGFDKEWNLAPESKLQDIQWVKDPKLRMVLFKINLRKFVDGAIEKNKDQLISKLDESLSKLIKTRQTIVKLWNDIQKPIRVNKKDTEIWLKAYADGIKATLEDNNPGTITLNIQLKAWVQLFIADQKMPPSNDKLPPYIKKEYRGDSLKIYVLAKVPYKKLNNILQRELHDKKLSAKGFSTTIKKISVYGTDEGIALDLKVSGDISGRVYIRGALEYDSANSTISAKDFHFDIDSENVLVNSADWLLHDDAISMIAEKLKLNLQPYADTLPYLIMNGIERGKSGEKFDLNISNLTVAPISHIYTHDDIQFIFEANGRADIELEKKVFAKKASKKNRVKEHL